jgi:hypothetical protein
MPDPLGRSASSPSVAFGATSPLRGRIGRPQNAALTENTTWLPAMVEPSLVLEKFGSR